MHGEDVVSRGEHIGVGGSVASDSCAWGAKGRDKKGIFI
jgi:hypothetical protein